MMTRVSNKLSLTNTVVESLQRDIVALSAAVSSGSVDPKAGPVSNLRAPSARVAAVADHLEAALAAYELTASIAGSAVGLSVIKHALQPTKPISPTKAGMVLEPFQDEGVRIPHGIFQHLVELRPGPCSPDGQQRKQFAPTALCWLLGQLSIAGSLTAEGGGFAVATPHKPICAHGFLYMVENVPSGGLLAVAV